MPQEVFRDPALDWLDHVQPVGLVVSSAVLKDLILEPIPRGWDLTHHSAPVPVREA